MKKNNPNEEFKPVSHDEQMGDKYVHPSFGTIGWTQWQGQGRALFGSSIMHHSAITITISHAELHRQLSRDWIFSRDPIVEIDISPAQFAEFITGGNGHSTPITLRRIGFQPLIPDPPFQHKIAEFNDEFEQRMSDLAKEFDAVISLANETHAQKRLVKDIELLKQMFKGNIPFITRQFSEQLDKTVTEAKAEVEAFTEQALKSKGLESLIGEAPTLKLTDGKDTGNKGDK